LTQPLGTGVISTAIKRNQAHADWIDAATASMTTLNQNAVEVIHQGDFPVHAATDVTGFGLIGHAREMAKGAKVSLRIQASQIPVLRGALECIRAGFIPGGLTSNRDFAECAVGYVPGISTEMKALLFDPQTAGGLLLAVPSATAPQLINALELGGVPAVRIGEVVPERKPLIEIV
jgi:selenide, water dikinase